MQPTIVFDLDGTLIDTAPDLIGTLNRILSQHGVPAVAFEDARGMIGAGVKPLLQRALASKGLQFAPDEIDRLFEEYLKLYAAHIADRSRPFPGLEAARDPLPARGWRSGGASTGSRRTAASWRCAPTSSNGSRCSSSTSSASRRASPRSAGRTRSRCASPIRRCCASRSRRPAATRVSLSSTMSTTQAMNLGGTGRKRLVIMILDDCSRLCKQCVSLEGILGSWRHRANRKMPPPAK